MLPPSTKDIFLPLQGLLEGEDPNANRINQAALHRLIFKKKNNNNKGDGSCNHILTHLANSVTAAKTMLMLEQALTCFSCSVLSKQPWSERETNCLLLSLFSTHQPHQRW